MSEKLFNAQLREFFDLSEAIETKEREYYEGSQGLLDINWREVDALTGIKELRLRLIDLRLSLRASLKDHRT